MRSRVRAASGASPRAAKRPSSGVRTMTTIPTTAASAITSSGQRSVPAPPTTARTTTPVASVTRSASTTGAERRTGTPYARRSRPHFSTSPSLPGVIVIVRPAMKMEKLRPSGILISNRSR